jgi:NitT/TauT family transport system substrate-binding protein
MDFINKVIELFNTQKYMDSIFEGLKTTLIISVLAALLGLVLGTIVAMVTIAKNANKSLNASLDLTEEWEKHFPADSLMQGCVVVRTEYLEKNEKVVKKFLEEYKSSIEFVNQNPADAGQMIADAGIFAQAPVASKAIPNSNICYIDGAEMKAGLQKFYEVLLATAPASIGNALPAEDFYYVP